MKWALFCKTLFRVAPSLSSGSVPVSRRLSVHELLIRGRETLTGSRAGVIRDRSCGYQMAAGLALGEQFPKIDFGQPACREHVQTVQLREGRRVFVGRVE